MKNKVVSLEEDERITFHLEDFGMWIVDLQEAIYKGMSGSEGDVEESLSKVQEVLDDMISKGNEAAIADLAKCDDLELGESEGKILEEGLNFARVLASEWNLKRIVEDGNE